MPHLELDDRCQLNYRADGAGLPLLLFNGASLPLEFWGGLADRLARGHRVVRFDQRNAGGTVTSGPFTLLDVTRDAARLLDALGIERAVVVGHAWGGRAAQVFVRDYPHRVTGLVVCGTGGQLPPVPSDALHATARDAIARHDRAAWEGALEALYCAPGFRDRDPTTFAEIATLLWGRRPPAGVTWDARVAPSATYWGTSRVPTLLVYGRHDRNGTPDNAADLHRRLPGSRLVMIEEAGHFVVRESEVRVADEIATFVATLP